jgi:hypothetical protein
LDWVARCNIAGIDVTHAIRKGQMMVTDKMPQTPAERFYSLAV